MFWFLKFDISFVILTLICQKVYTVARQPNISMEDRQLMIELTRNIEKNIIINFFCPKLIRLNTKFWLISATSCLWCMFGKPEAANFVNSHFLLLSNRDDNLHGKGTLYKKNVKTSISSKAFCSITDRQTEKIFTE